MSDQATIIEQKTMTMPQSFIDLFMRVIDCPKEKECFLTEQLGGGSTGFMHATEFERHTHAYARELSDDYKSEKWTLVSIPDDLSFFSYPSNDGEFYELDRSMRIDNKIFGLLCSIVGLENAADRPSSERAIANLFHFKYEKLEHKAFDAIDHLLETQTELAELMSLTWLRELISYYADC